MNLNKNPFIPVGQHPHCYLLTGKLQAWEVQISIDISGLLKTFIYTGSDLIQQH